MTHRVRSMQSLIAIAALALVAGGVLLGVGPNVSPPAPGGVVNSIHSFATDHPEFQVLEKGRKDKTPLVMGHAKHMNADTPGMQERLRAWVKGLLGRGVEADRIPVRSFDGGAVDAANVDKAKLTLTCVACHQTDAAGRYMQPIRFELHCAQCHGLGENGGEAVPHGKAVAAFIDRKVAMAVASPATKPAEPAPSSPGPRRGPGGRPAASAGPEPLPFTTKPELAAYLTEQFNEKRNDLYNAIVKNQCAYCHRGIVGLRDDAPGTGGAQWAKLDWSKVDPHIPDRWLPRSVFSHAAHPMMKCTECHEIPAADRASSERVTDLPLDVPAWTGATSDIMLPSINACRTCHSPTTQNVRSDCVACHIFHGSGESRAALSVPPPSR